MLESVIATSEFHLPKKILSSVFPAPYSTVAPKTPWKILLLLLTVGDFHPLADQSFGAQVRCRIRGRREAAAKRKRIEAPIRRCNPRTECNHTRGHASNCV